MYIHELNQNARSIEKKLETLLFELNQNARSIEKNLETLLFVLYYLSKTYDSHFCFSCES